MGTLPISEAYVARSLHSPFSEAVKDFEETYPKRPKTMLEYRRSLLRFAEATGTQTLSDLTPLKVERYLAGKIKAGRASVARNDAIALKTFSRWLHDHGITPTDTLAAIRVPKPLRRGRPPYADHEIQAILKSTDRWAQDGNIRQPYRDRAIVLLALDSGMRLDELRRLEYPRDVDLEKGWVHIRESKTEAGKRPIPLTPRVRTELHMYLMDERPHQGPGTFFLNQQGRQFTYYGFANLAQYIRKRLLAAGVKDFKFHRLRNTKTLLARRAGWSDTVIKKVMGWEGYEMIERYAGAPTEEELRSLPSTTERFFRAS